MLLQKANLFLIAGMFLDIENLRLHYSINATWSDIILVRLQLWLKTTDIYLGYKFSEFFYPGMGLAGLS